MKYLAECLEDFRSLKLSAAEFQAQVCPKCRNGKCELSRWQGDPMAERVAHQPDRFFRPNQADPHSSRYAHLVDFGSLLHRAMQLEVADRRKDWVVPEIKVLDGKIEAATKESTRQVEEAVRSLRREPEPVPEPEPEVTIETEGWPEEPVPEDEPEPIRPAPPPPLPPARRTQPPPPERLPTKGNVPVPGEGIMVGGGPAPQQGPAPDPWATPAPGPRTVPAGARIRFGLTGEIDGKS